MVSPAAGASHPAWKRPDLTHPFPQTRALRETGADPLLFGLRQLQPLPCLDVFELLNHTGRPSNLERLDGFIASETDQDSFVARRLIPNRGLDRIVLRDAGRPDASDPRSDRIP